MYCQVCSSLSFQDVHRGKQETSASEWCPSIIRLLIILVLSFLVGIKAVLFYRYLWLNLLRIALRMRCGHATCFG